MGKPDLQGRSSAAGVLFHVMIRGKEQSKWEKGHHTSPLRHRPPTWKSVDPIAVPEEGEKGGKYCFRVRKSAMRLDHCRNPKTSKKKTNPPRVAGKKKEKNRVLRDELARRTGKNGPTSTVANRQKEPGPLISWEKAASI